MEKQKNKKTKKNSGAAMLISIVFFLFISLAIISGLVSPAIREFKIATDGNNSKQSYFLSESGAEDAFYRLKTAKPIGASTVITIGSNTATTTISDSGYNQKTITSLGDVSLIQRKSRAVVSAGAGVGFNYGIQVGTGGFVLSGGSKVIGSVYSNGNIQASEGVQITGSAVAAGATSYIGDGVGSPYMGTVVVGSAGIGDAWAYKVIGGNVAGNLYCQIGNNNNKTCNTSKGVPPIQPMPFTDDNITDWKNTAAAGGIITGATNCPGGYSGGSCTVDYRSATFGPGKITGNLTVSGGDSTKGTGILTLTGTVWVVGTVTVTGGGSIRLPSGYLLNSETIVSDNLVTINGGGSLGSGNPNSYLFIVSTSNSNSAITVTGGAGAIAVDAQNGTVNLSGAASLSSAVGKKITAIGGTNVIYQQGLASPSFQGGPSGGWGLSSWKEI